MSDVEDLLKVDWARREAMISGSSSDLAATLSDELVWTHSSGRTDDKQAVLNAIETKSVIYESLQVEDYAISEHGGGVFIYHGILMGKVVKDGAEKNLKNKFLSVWQRSGSSFEMLAWQSTGF
jgi:hypothetical protein